TKLSSKLYRLTQVTSCVLEHIKNRSRRSQFAHHKRKVSSNCGKFRDRLIFRDCLPDCFYCREIEFHQKRSPVEIKVLDDIRMKRAKDPDFCRADFYNCSAAWMQMASTLGGAHVLYLSAAPRHPLDHF